MANETMRILFPLKIIIYPQGEYGLEDNPMDITSAEAVAYEDAILDAIEKENHLFENDRGLAKYIRDEALNKKVHSLYPSVETVDGKLWGVMTAGLKESLSGEETAELLEFVAGQNTDGYGEILEQRPIKTPDGEIYISLWSSDKNWNIMTQVELEQSQQMGGMKLE